MSRWIFREPANILSSYASRHNAVSWHPSLEMSWDNSLICTEWPPAPYECYYVAKQLPRSQIGRGRNEFLSEDKKMWLLPPPCLHGFQTRFLEPSPELNSNVPRPRGLGCVMSWSRKRSRKRSRTEWWYRHLPRNFPENFGALRIGAGWVDRRHTGWASMPGLGRNRRNSAGGDSLTWRNIPRFYWTKHSYHRRNSLVSRTIFIRLWLASLLLDWKKSLKGLPCSISRLGVGEGYEDWCLSLLRLAGVVMELQLAFFPPQPVINVLGWAGILELIRLVRYIKDNGDK